MAAQSVGLRPIAKTKVVVAAVVLLGALQLVAAAPARAGEGNNEGFIQTNLVSNLPDIANVQDTNLKNPWGLVHSPTSPWWVSDNNHNVSTLYNGSGTPFPPGSPLVVNIPSPDPNVGGTPTGIVFNGNPNDFKVTDGKNTGPSLFLFATEDGTIVGWNPSVSVTQAFIAVDKSQIPDATNGAVYKGLAIVQTGEGQRVYASNFRAGTVDVFDAKFKAVHVKGAFTDKRIPAGYAPFGIQAIGNRIYVTYAVQNATKHDDLKGAHRGFVDVFSTEGKLLKRLIRRGALNSPWGLALAPKGFGDLSGDLLVGNFGDGTINAYDIRSGEFEGTLLNPSGAPIVIDGLWAIAFGNDHSAGPSGTLFFTAGIHEEVDGLFGSLVPAPRTED
jgi:uncharacterized protein (TIGR03118 family)